MNKTIITESIALRISSIGAFFFAVLGIFIAIQSRSNALLLDAGYSCISAIMSLLAIQVAKRLHAQRSRRFHFGYYAFEPFFVVIKGALIFLAAVFAMASSVESLLHGGKNVQVTLLLEYLLFSVVACYAIAWFLSIQAKKHNSQLLLAERTSWMLDATLCIGAFIAFSLAIPLARSPYAWLIPYIDPVLTIAIVLGLILEPLKLIKSGILDLLLAAPPASVLSSMQNKLDPFCAEYGFTRIDINASKLGRILFVTIFCICPQGYRIDNVETLDSIKEKMNAALAREIGTLEITVILTAQQSA